MPIVVMEAQELEALIERAVSRALERAGRAPVLTTAQAAAVAGVTQKTVQDWIASGRLAAGHRGRLRTVMRDDLDRFLAGERREAGRSAAEIDASLRVPRPPATTGRRGRR